MTIQPEFATVQTNGIRLRVALRRQRSHVRIVSIVPAVVGVPIIVWALLRHPLTRPDLEVSDAYFILIAPGLLER